MGFLLGSFLVCHSVLNGSLTGINKSKEKNTQIGSQLCSVEHICIKCNLDLIHMQASHNVVLVLNTIIVAFVQSIHTHVFQFDTLMSAIHMIHDQLIHKKRY